MKKALCALFVVLFLVFQPYVMADDQESLRLVSNFLDALKINDRAMITAAWKELDASPEAKSYMEQNSLWAASAFRLTGASLGVPVQSSAPQVLTTGGLPSPTSGSAAPQELLPPSNRDSALLHPNQEQPSNQQAVQRSANAPLIDNATRAISRPNQDERSNQEVIYNQLKRMKSMPQ